MNILFMLGNGFDLNLGLKTRYADFYEFYKRKRANDTRPYVMNFLQELAKKNNIRDWSDFEKAFGEYANEFNQNTLADYIDLWEDIHTALSEYLDSATTIGALKRPSSIFPDVTKYLIYPEGFIPKGAQAPISTLRDNIGNRTIIDVINFNYTNTFERLYGYNGVPVRFGDNPLSSPVLRSVEHVHGTTAENMILGVDNAAQIRSSEGLSRDKQIQYRLVKPIANKNTQAMRDVECAKRIAEANLICIFGMSLGITDMTWWQQIAKRLKSPDARLLIFAKNSKVPRSRGYLAIEHQEQKVEQFLRATGASTNISQELIDKITVAFDSKIFEKFAGMAS